MRVEQRFSLLCRAKPQQFVLEFDASILLEWQNRRHEALQSPLEHPNAEYSQRRCQLHNLPVTEKAQGSTDRKPGSVTPEQHELFLLKRWDPKFRLHWWDFVQKLQSNWLEELRRNDPVRALSRADVRAFLKHQWFVDVLLSLIHI